MTIGKFSFVHALLAVSALLLAMPMASAATTGPGYRVFSGDFNGDGLTDYYVKPQVTIVPIPFDDLSIPTPIRPKMGAFVLQRKSATDTGYTVVFNLSAAQLATLNTWTTESHKAIRGDFNGDGKEDLLLQAIQVGGTSIVVNGAGDRTVAPVFNKIILPSTYDVDVAVNSGVTIQVSDVDGDHWDDLILQRAGQPNMVIVSRVRSLPSDFPVTGVDPSADTLTGAVYNGALRGDYSVDPNGAFTYKVPIQVPPGVNGVEPKLSLQYNSNKGNGSLGVGWGLAGLSVIDRCPASVLRDGYASGIDAGELYKFCLDGQRLVEVATGQYRLESESFVHIRRVGGSVAVPDYWVVEQGNGSVLTYGGTSDSELEDRTGQTAQWYLQREQDVAGNYLTYSYLKSANEHRIDHINYTMNDAAPGVQVLNQLVSFFYESRPDPSSSYYAGVLRTMSNRLSRIELRSQNALIRQYLLSYQVVDGSTYADPVKTSRIQQITQCAASTSDCLTPINLAWTDMGADSVRMNDYSVGGATYLSTPGPVRDLSQPWYQLADVDGDGYLDWIDTPALLLTGGSMTWFGDLSVHYGTEAITDTTVMTDYLQRLRNQPAVLVHTFESSTHTYHIHSVGGGQTNDSDDTVATTVHVAMMDIDGDGRVDMVVTDNFNQRGVMVYLNQGNRTFAYSSTYSLPQAAVTFQGSITCPTQITTTVTGSFPARMVYRDFNGDGRVDLLRYFPDKGCGVPVSEDLSVALNQPGGGFSAFQPWLTAPAAFRGAVLGNQPLQLGDFNGDGLPDLIGANGQVAINTGSHFEFRAEWPALPQSTTYPNKFVLGDFNGDGLTDLIIALPDPVHPLPNGSTIKISTGAGFADAYTGASCQVSFAINIPDSGLVRLTDTHSALADMNGDGRDDILYYSGDASSNAPGAMTICFANHVTPGATDGFTAVDMTSGNTPNLKDVLATANYWRHIDSPYVQTTDIIPSPADYNSDGIPDWVSTSRMHKHQVLSVAEGTSRQLTVSYLPLAAHGLHSPASVTSSAPIASYSNTPVGLATGGEGTLATIGYRSIALDPYAGLQAVNSLMVSDGIGGAHTKAFHYQGGKRQVGGWGSLGFEQVTETEQVSSSEVRRTETDYFQIATNAYPFAGRPKERRVYATDASRGALQMLSRERFNYRIRLYGDDIDSGFLSPHYFPYLAENSKETWDLNGSQKATTLVRNYGSYSPTCSVLGAPTLTEMYADTDYHADGVLFYGQSVTCDALPSTAAVQFSSVTHSQISQQGTAFGLVGRQVQTAGVGSSTAGLTLATRTTAFTYISGRGQLYTKTIEPDAGADLNHTTTYSYNVYGSASNVTESWQNTLNNGLSFTSRSTTNTESYTGGIRQVIRTNPLNQTETVAFNPAFGLPSQVTDVNQHTTSTFYDTQGRVSYVLHSDGRRSDFAYRSCVSCFTDNSLTAYYIQQKNTGTASVRSFRDGLDREVGSLTHGLDGAEIYTLKTYNHEGLVALTRDPYKVGDTYANTTYSYDILARVKTTTYADSTTQVMVYNGLNQTLTNRLQQVQVRVFNGAGWVMSNTDNAGTPVVFTYWPFGELQSTTVNNNSATVAQVQYDIAGRKTQLSDPNTGTINYTYNALGLLATQTDAKGQVTRYTYDALGRQTQRIDSATGSNPRTHTWEYDTQLNGTGLLGGMSGFNTDGTAFSEAYTYNSNSLLENTTTTIDSRSFVMTLHYDNFSRPIGKTYPSGFATGNYYNNFGQVYQVNSMDDGRALWTANSQDARGNITQYTLGNGVVTNKTFDWASGYVRTINASKGSLVIQDHSYTFDSLGNLTERRSGSIVQDFCYDNMNRLVAARFNGCSAGTSDFSYDALGNKFNAGVGSNYGENGAGPHAITTVNGKSYRYDANGSLTGIFNGATLERAVHYSPFNTPTRISDTNGHWSEIVYGPMQGRVKRTDSTGRTSMYSALGSYEETTFNGITERVHYLGDFALYVEQSGSANGSYYRYLHHDHIGSTIAKSDEQATAAANIEWLANGPWGERRHQTWNGAAEGISYQPITTARAFTNHEHLDGLGLIHMNGRVYDEVTGRFLSPDPMVQAPYNTQSYNRYSYVFNNPLSFTDPSGYGTEDDKNSTQTAHEDKYTYLQRIFKDGTKQIVRIDNETGDTKESPRFVPKPGVSDAAYAAYFGQQFDREQAIYAQARRAEWDVMPWYLKAMYYQGGKDGGNYETESPEEFSRTWLQNYSSMQPEEGGGALNEGAVATAAAVALAKNRTVIANFFRNLVAKIAATGGGGRLGNAATREHIDRVATEMERRGWTITHGGGRGPEEYIPGPGGARKGSSYPDITATKDGQTLRVNTIDTYADGLTPTTREAANAARIRAQTGEHLLLIPKP